MAEGLPPASMPATAAATPVPVPSASVTAPAQAPKAAVAQPDAATDPLAGMFALLMNDPARAATPAPSAPAAETAMRDGARDDDSAPPAAPDALLLVLAQVTPPATAPMPTDAALPGATNQAMPAAAAQPATNGIAPAQQRHALPGTDALPMPISASGTDNVPPQAPLPAPQPDGQQAVAPATAFTAIDAAAPLPGETPTPAPQSLSSVHAPTPSMAQTAPVAMVVPQPLQQPVDASAGYDDSFGTQVAWLAGQRIGEAQIRVSPEHLGTIDIRLQLDGTQVRAEFHSAQPEVRQTLEASLPRLRDMLGQHGLQLAHAGVGQGHRQRDDTAPAQMPRTTSRNEGDAVPSPVFRRARGLVDVYA